MIKFFFNRFSWMVLAMELAGLVLLALAGVRILKGSTSSAQAILLIIDALLYAFIRICATKRWYRGVPRYSGIELQFHKALVPASYTMAVSLTWFTAAPSAVPLAVAALLLVVVAHVNVILLYLRRRDLDFTPVNFYSSGRFLNSSQ